VTHASKPTPLPAQAAPQADPDAAFLCASQCRSRFKSCKEPRRVASERRAAAIRLPRAAGCRYNPPFSLFLRALTMEAERLNAISNKLADLKARSSNRRYL
jgi:hypothetical protein